MSVPLVLSMLSGHERFAVTGASGWLGRTTLELLASALGPKRFRERVTGFASAPRTMTLQDGTEAHLQPLTQLVNVVPAPTHILHYAYLTRDRVTAVGVPEYVRANMAITATVVDAIERFHPLGVFTTSSGAVYRPDRSFVSDVTADPYGALKHLEELAVRRAAADVGARSAVVRIFSLAGAYMTKPELYALGDLILQALAGGTMKVRARGRVHRSFCAASDVVSLGLACVLRGSAGNDVVFDSGGDVVEVGELAQYIRQTLGCAGTEIERHLDPDAGEDRYVGDGAAMSALAVEHDLSLTSLSDQILDTASFLRAGGALSR